MRTLQLGCFIVWAGAVALVSEAAAETAPADPKPNPCSASPDIAAYAASASKQCYVEPQTSESRSKAKRQIAMGVALRAGEQITCSKSGTVTLTFCATGQDIVVQGKETPLYIVPNVSREEASPDSDPLKPALRSASLEIPTCAKKIGTLAVVEPQNRWWTTYNLESPEGLLKVMATKSGCFTLVDRGKGLAAAQSERALGNDGSSIGKGQLYAADYVLVPDLVQSGPKSAIGKLGGLFGGASGALSIKSKTANVLLTLTDVRSTEQVSLQEGHAKKTNFGANAFARDFAASGASSYVNTEIGQVVTAAYLDAFTKLVTDAQAAALDAKSDNSAPKN